nr:hypothetical protein [Tanacetum cinerariifolium]
MVSALKLPVLKTREYDLWSMRMEQYLTFTDHALWEVIVNARKNELKAKSTLMLAILDEYLLKFHACKDAKSLWEAIKNSDGDDNQVNDRFKKDEGYHAVLPPYTGNYMPPRADLSFVGLDNSVFKSKESDSKDKNVFKPKEITKTVKPSLEKIEFVNARNTTVENENKAEKPRKFSQIPIAASVSAVRCVNTAASRPNVDNALPITYSYFKAHSPKPTESEGFEQIIDFLNASYVKYALTINPTVYTSCIEQLWATAKVKNANGDAHIQALVDKKKNKQKLRRKQRKEIEVLTPSSEIPNEESVPTPFNDPLHSGEDRMQLNELMILCTYLQEQVLDLEEAKTAQAKEIASLKKRVMKLEQKRKSRTSRLKRLRKVGTASRIESSTEASLGDQEDGRMNEEDMFEVNDLGGDEVVVDVSASKKVEQSVKVIEKEVSTDDLVTTAGEVVTTAGIKVTTAAITLQISKDKLTLAQALIEIKADFSQQPLNSKDKGKGIMVEPKKSLKKKDQIMVDEEVARNLEAHMQAELEEKERLAKQKEEETNIDLIES